jgi:hypothetical protein
MKNYLFAGLLFMVLLQSCNQADPPAKKQDAFTKYINSNTNQQETANEQSKPIVNVAF